MAETRTQSATQPQDAGRRKIVVGEVVSSRNTNPRELMELEDAMRTIRYLAKHELQS